MRVGPLLAWATLLAGCGERPTDAPPLPMAKVPPTLPRMVRQRTLNEWLAEARSQEPPRVVAALFALPELTSDVVLLGGIVEPLLRQPDPDLRYAALVALARLSSPPGPEATRAVVELLGTRASGVARAVRAALPTLDPAVLGPLVLERWFREPGVRPDGAVLEALGSLGEAGGWAAPALLDALGPEEPGRAAVLRALEQLGDAALPEVARRLPQAPDELAALLLGVMAQRGPAALAPQAPALLQALHRGGEVRRAAGEALLSLGSACLADLDRLSQGTDPQLASVAADLASRIRNP